MTRSFDVMNGYVNNREAGDLRRHHAHYDVTVMDKVAVYYLSESFNFWLKSYTQSVTFSHQSVRFIVDAFLCCTMASNW